MHLFIVKTESQTPCTVLQQQARKALPGKQTWCLHTCRSSGAASNALHVFVRGSQHQRKIATLLRGVKIHSITGRRVHIFCTPHTQHWAALHTHSVAWSKPCNHHCSCIIVGPYSNGKTAVHNFYQQLKTTASPVPTAKNDFQAKPLVTCMHHGSILFTVTQLLYYKSNTCKGA